MAVFEVTIEETGEVYRCSSEESLLCGMERLGKRGIPVGCRCGGCGVCKVRIGQGDYQKRVMSREHISLEEEAAGLENFVKSAAANPKQFPDYGHRLGEIAAPALIIWGRNDRFVPMDVGLRLVWGMQNAELHIFYRCGHWAQWEHADKFNRMVLDFLTH